MGLPPFALTAGSLAGIPAIFCRVHDVGALVLRLSQTPAMQT